jgi:predicted DNA-binding transcriptional regulator YafY
MSLMGGKMYFPTTRVLTVLELLQSRQKISGPELAERLEVDTRTVRRYITMLQDLGIPVEAERGRYGSYRLRPGFKLPPLMFTDEEALALTLGLLSARKLGLTDAALAVEGALAKIERVLPALLRDRVRALQETLVIDFPAKSTPPAPALINRLSEAALQRRSVMLCYQGWHAEVTERLLNPYGLVYRSGYWYTVGYCHLRKELRTFRLDRIQSAEIQATSFERPGEFDCLAYVLASLPRTPGTWLVDVLLNTTLENAQHIVPPALALLEQEAEGVSFRCYVDDLEWIAYVLVGLRCSFVIRQPSELHDALRTLAQRINALAE